MSTTEAPKATAQGTLATTPFSHLLQFILTKELSGTLAVWPDVVGDRTGVGQDRVLFQHGLPLAMRSTNGAANLRDGLHDLFVRQKAPYAFYERQNLLGREDGQLRDQVDPFAVIWRGVRAYAQDAHVRGVLSKLGGRPVRLRVGFPIARLDLAPEDLAIVDALRREPLTLADTVRRCGQPAAVAERVLYALTLLKGLESLEASERGASVRPSAAPARSSGAPASSETTPTPSHARVSRSPVAHSQPPAAPASIPPPSDAPIPAKPAGLEPGQEALWDEAVARFADLDHQTHFALLGVETRATTSEITSAYFALVKKWHPERVPAALEPLSEHIQTMFERMTEAHEVLTTDDKRLAYVKAVSDGGGTRASERMMAAVVGSAMDMQKAEVLLRRRNYAEAKAWVDQAIASNPDEASNYAVRGWLSHLLQPGQDAPLTQILADIDRTLTDNDRNAKAHYYKGVVLKRMGDSARALPHFRRAMELDPRNIEAQREVRLAEIRRNSIKPGKKPGGLWGKLFSKS